MPVVHLIHMTTEMMKSLQYTFNEGIITYIKKLFKIKNNLWTMMIYGCN